MKKIIVLLVLMFAMMGCQSGIMKKLVQSPEVQSISLKSFSASDAKVVFDVQLFNPNDFALPIKGFTGYVKLNNLAVGNFTAKTKQNLAAKKTQTLTLPISLDAEAFGQAARSVLSERKALYNLSGGVDTSVGEVPFSQEGELSVQEILATLLPSFGF